MRPRLKSYAAALICVLAAIPGQAAFAANPAPTTPSQSSAPTGTKSVSKPEVKAAPMATQVIAGTPVRIEVRDSGSASVYYNDVSQFYSGNGEGVFIWADNQVYGPNDLPFGPVVNPYTVISNVLSGTGTAQNPWRIVTTLGLGATGLQLVRSIRYINGDLFSRQDFEVRNYNTRSYNINLFHAADLRTAGEDSGYGFYDAGSGGIGGYNQARTFYQLFVPISGGSHYQEGVWNDIWGAIGNTSGPGPGFANSYHPDTYEDNGAGLQWSYTLPAGARFNVADFHTFTTSVGCSSNFLDVFPDDYYFMPISYLACTGVLSGYGDGTFRPGNPTTRGQLSKIIVIAKSWTIDTTGGPHFTDVPTTNPFYGYVETAYHHGIISGYGDGTFRTNAAVTRAQLSKIIVSAQGWAIDTTGGPHFTDVPSTDPFYGFIETAYHHAIISGYGDGTFRPGVNATRGQISKIVYSAVTAP